MNPKERSSGWKSSEVKKKPMQKQTAQENNQRSEIARRRVRSRKGDWRPEKKEENRARREQNKGPEGKGGDEGREKEWEENLRKRGERLTKNQPKIAGWFRKEGPGSKRAPTGGKTGV